MKNFIILFLFFSCAISAQDTIRFRNGSRNAVKVNEITDTEIKYNTCDNPDGPVYVAEINEVKSIRYKNGSEDSFSIISQSEPLTSPKSYPVFAERDFQKIKIMGKALSYNRKGLDNRELFGIIETHPDINTKNMLMKEFSLVKEYRKSHGTGLALLFGGMVFSVVSLGLDTPASGAGFFIGTGGSVLGAIIANVNRNKHNAQRVKVARIYNGEEYNFR